MWFDGGDDGRGSKIRIPVMVLKGERDGRKLFLSAATHGDELNGIQLIYRLFEVVSATELKGTIVAVPGLNPSGILNSSRYFEGSSNG